MVNIFSHVKDVIQGKTTLGESRSNKWPQVREKHLKKHPRCALCGGTKKLNVHHKKPFHLFPYLELSESNLITLCEGKNSLNCHLAMGHLMLFKSYNPNVDRDTVVWKARIYGRP